jgi:hypothetical protein
MSDKFICESCGQPKARLESKRSKVMAGKQLLMCKTCISKNFEPRYLLIIAYNSSVEMRKKSKPFILDRRYVGDEIVLAEVL